MKFWYRNQVFCDVKHGWCLILYCKLDSTVTVDNWPIIGSFLASQQPNTSTISNLKNSWHISNLRWLDPFNIPDQFQIPLRTQQFLRLPKMLNKMRHLKWNSDSGRSSYNESIKIFHMTCVDKKSKYVVWMSFCIIWHTVCSCLRTEGHNLLLEGLIFDMNYKMGCQLSCVIW